MIEDKMPPSVKAALAQLDTGLIDRNICRDEWKAWSGWKSKKRCQARWVAISRQLYPDATENLA